MLRKCFSTGFTSQTFLFMRTVLSVLFLTVLTGCSSYRQIGQLNMISIRNISHGSEYELLQRNVGGSPEEIKTSRHKTIDEAINYTVREIPGGEYLMNVKVYAVKGKRYAAEGDVWGQLSAKEAEKNTYSYINHGRNTLEIKVISRVNNYLVNAIFPDGKIRKVRKDRIIYSETKIPDKQ